jgi:hypothetical protein
VEKIIAIPRQKTLDLLSEKFIDDPAEDHNNDLAQQDYYELLDEPNYPFLEYNY